MHSFSITRYRYPDERVMEKLDSILKYIQDQPALEAISTTDFINFYRDNDMSCSQTQSFVPHTGFLLTCLMSWQRFGDGRKNIVVALTVPGLFMIALFIGLAIRRKRLST